MKHILALTYGPKIPDVRSGKCTQTIRPCSQRPRKKDDQIMFHGWSGKPYRSKWNWRTPYWKIEDVIPIKIYRDTVIVQPLLVIEREMNPDDMDALAQMDGFKNYNEMYQEFKRMYGCRLNKMIFEIIRWKYAL